eukprot:gene35833-43460_t
MTASAEEAERVNSQLKLILRPMYSNPPLHGAHIVSEVLSDPALRAQGLRCVLCIWSAECKEMAERIQKMRTLLRSKLEQGSGRSWTHATEQIGMFCYTGPTEQQVRRLKDEFHIYYMEDGRFSMAGINSHNVDYLAKSVVA